MTTVSFDYDVVGSGETIILLHAGVCDSRMWEPQFHAFAEAGYRVVRYDLRGWGRTPIPDGAFGYHQDVIALCDELGVEKAWLVGASHGGKVALDTVLTFPERVHGMVLAAPAVGGWQGGDLLQSFGDEEDALLEEDKLQEATELNLKMWVDGPYRTPDQVPADLRRNVEAMQLQAFEIPTPDNAVWVRIEPPAIHRLDEIKVPALVVVGALDVPDFVELANHVAVTIPGAHLEVIPEVAHLSSMEAPGRFNEIVLNFLGAGQG